MDEHVHVDFLPGTSRLFADEAQAATAHLKRDGEIVLSPQPSDSPNDPLNWSLPRKYLHAILLVFVTGLTAATANDAGSAQDGMHAEYGITYETMNIGAGVLFVGIGYWTYLISPAASLYGRRIVYLVSMLLGLLGAIWFTRVRRPSDAILNQLFVGASESVGEASVQLSLSEIFFEHQVGSVIGIYVLATNVGNYLGPIIAAYVAEYLGWRWIAWLAVIICACTLVVLFFALEETMFDRAAHRTIDGLRGDARADGGAPATCHEKKSATATAGDGDLRAHRSSDVLAVHVVDEPRPYRQRVQIITRAPNLRGTGFKQYLGRLWHTLRIFGFPAVVYSGIQWGAQNAWLTFYMTVEQYSWYGPPRNYSVIATGLMNVPCIIGVVVGCFWGGYLSDRFVLWMAKRRHGIREAEDRLLMMAPCLVCSPAGMLIFGIGSAYGWDWPAPYFGLGLIGFGWGCAGDLSMSYLMDAYPEMVLEGMVGVAVINNSIGYIFTFTASKWLIYSGVRNCFIVISVLDFLFIGLTLPMILYGKSCRRWTLKRYRDFVEIRDTI
ncbi:hypothetical protein B2J93_5446 [Marssonina coronariae]|uniref:Major facilitator superfamily (MFS) profile domain-containing protein n=1 Tax=Diplocarpon coronariae TaxID=2795749 RepID=A0A218Z1Q3_9HELO|nr:hypothetical protein B2J93_5446 [Marssonina coronariae]